MYHWSTKTFKNTENLALPRMWSLFKNWEIKRRTHRGYAMKENIFNWHSLKQQKRPFNTIWKWWKRNWIHKNYIFVISTDQKFELTLMANRNGDRKMKLNIVANNKKFLSEMDRANHMVLYCFTSRKIIGWYLRLLFYEIGICIWNTCWAYKKNITYTQFRNKKHSRILQKVFSSVS